MSQSSSINFGVCGIGRMGRAVPNTLVKALRLTAWWLSVTGKPHAANWRRL